MSAASERRIRVLHVTESWGAGVEQAVRQYCQAPVAEHHLLATRRREGENAEPVSVANATFVRSAVELAIAWLRTRRELYDVVHAHSTIAGVLTRAYPHPTATTVYSPHGLAIHHRDAWVRRVASRTESWLSRRTSAFAAVSNHEAAELTELCAGRRPITVVPHALHAADPPRPLASRGWNVLAVGRIGYQKNPEALSELPSTLGRLLPRVSFTWCGDGETDRKDQLQEAGWSVTGWLPHYQIAEYMENARLLVHPARYEGLPLAVMEAIALGTPVLAAPLPSMIGVPGVRTFNDAKDLTFEAYSMLNNESLWKDLQQAGLAHIKKEHSPAAQATALDSCYQSLCARDQAGNLWNTW